jgi:sulfate transport system substrate-binding protein
LRSTVLSTTVTGGSAKAQAKYASQFPRLTLFTIDQAFGGWARADKEHFADGASFDQIYMKR